MPATVCTLVVSWVLETERGGRRTGAAQLVPSTVKPALFLMK